MRAIRPVHTVLNSLPQFYDTGETIVGDTLKLLPVRLKPHFLDLPAERLGFEQSANERLRFIPVLNNMKSRKTGLLIVDACECEVAELLAVSAIEEPNMATM